MAAEPDAYTRDLEDLVLALTLQAGPGGTRSRTGSVLDTVDPTTLQRLREAASRRNERTRSVGTPQRRRAAATSVALFDTDARMGGGGRERSRSRERDSMRR